MFCQNCGKEQAEDSTYCNGCGRALHPSGGRSHFSPEPLGIVSGIALIACLYLLPIIPLASLDPSVSVVITGWIPLDQYLSRHDASPVFSGISLARWAFYLLWLAGLSLVLVSLGRRVKG